MAGESAAVSRRFRWPPASHDKSNREDRRPPSPKRGLRRFIFTPSSPPTTLREKKREIKRSSFCCRGRRHPAQRSLCLRLVHIAPYGGWDPVHDPHQSAIRTRAHQVSPSSIHQQQAAGSRDGRCRRTMTTTTTAPKRGRREFIGDTPSITRRRPSTRRSLYLGTHSTGRRAGRQTSLRRSHCQAGRREGFGITLRKNHTRNRSKSAWSSTSTAGSRLRRRRLLRPLLQDRSRTVEFPREVPADG